MLKKLFRNIGFVFFILLIIGFAGAPAIIREATSKDIEIAESYNAPVLTNIGMEDGMFNTVRVEDFKAQNNVVFISLSNYENPWAVYVFKNEDYAVYLPCSVKDERNVLTPNKFKMLGDFQTGVTHLDCTADDTVRPNEDAMNEEFSTMYIQTGAGRSYILRFKKGIVNGAYDIVTSLRNYIVKNNVKSQYFNLDISSFCDIEIYNEETKQFEKSQVIPVITVHLNNYDTSITTSFFSDYYGGVSRVEKIPECTIPKK